MLKGQMSIWDIDITKQPSSFTKTEEKVTKFETSFTKIISKITPEENDKSLKPLELTEKQQGFLDKKSVMKNKNLSRIIRYCGGGLGVELRYEDSYKTTYINAEGKEEYEFNKKLSVLPMDRIIYFKEELKANQLQEQRLKELKDNAIKVIKRKGDESIIVELVDKVASINNKGWVLEFNNCKAIYEESEIVNVEEKPSDKKALDDVKVGDIVETYYGKEIIEGKVISEYGIGNQILNIVFDNGKKQTAIGRTSVIKIIESRLMTL